MIFDTVEEEVESIIGAIFHQDVNSLKEATDDCIKRNCKEALVNTAELIEKYLKSDASDEEKNEFIASCVMIDFDYVKQVPIEWLKEFGEALREGAKTKK